jgi:hypothetical protein
VTVSTKAFFLCVLGFIFFQGVAFSKDGAENLKKAKAALEKKDFVSMVTELKGAVENSGAKESVVKEVEQLLEKGFLSAGPDGLPAPWKLPQEITKLKVGIRLTQKNSELVHSIKVYGEVKPNFKLEQVRLVRYPNEVIVDRKAGIGNWMEAPARGKRDPEFGLEVSRGQNPAAAGLYLLDAILDNGTKFDAWFFISKDMNYSKAPKLKMPKAGEVLSTVNPVLEWSDPISREPRPYENRAIWIGVFLIEPPSPLLKWELGKRSPTLTTAQVGKTEHGQGVSELTNGKHTLSITYNEERTFGGIFLRRESSVNSFFQVRP